MAKQVTAAGTERPGIMTRIKQFLHEVSEELKKVTWPGKEEVKSSTQIVMTLLVLVAGIIYVFDVVFGFIIQQMLIIL